MSDRRIEDLGDSLAVPRKNGELVFEAPWEGRVFGMAVVLSDDQLYAWDDFRDHLVAEIAAAEEHGDASGYYERWLASFERLLLDSGVVTAEELDTRTAEYAAGVYDEHEHYETTSDAIASLTRSPHTSGGAQHRLARRRGADQRLPPPRSVVRLRDRLLLRAHRTRPRAGSGGALSPRVGAAAHPPQGASVAGRVPGSLRALERGAAAVRRPPDLVPLDRR